MLASPDGFASPGFGVRSEGQGSGHGQDGCATRCRPAWSARDLRRPLAILPLVSEALVTRYRDLVPAPGVRDAMIARMEQVMLVNPVPLLRQIQAPTLIWARRMR